MTNFKVFNVEFDGMDKCGKDSIAKQIFAVDPNKYIINVRGIMSQIAYSWLWKREYVYEMSKGYLENTLFVYLTVNEDDWNVRCKLSGEHEKNKKRTDVESAIEYKTSNDAFEHANEVLKQAFDNYGVSDKHILKLNTSEMTPYQIILKVVERLNELNEGN